jgi:hypothetical protein
MKVGMNRLVILIVFVSVAGLRAPADDLDQGSCRAEVFVPESLKQPQVIPSPDGLLKVVLGGYREENDAESGLLSIFKGKALLGRYRLHDLSAGVFVKWSRDSRAFYLMWSNGGMIGRYNVRIFRVSSSGVREIFPTKLAEAEFKRRHNCATRGVNIFAIRWLQNADVMIAMQVYPTSDCGKEMGFTRGYKIRLDGTVVERYPQEIVEKEMKSCPTLIWPTGLWDDQTLQQAKDKLELNANKP